MPTWDLRCVLSASLFATTYRTLIPLRRGYMTIDDSSSLTSVSHLIISPARRPMSAYVGRKEISMGDRLHA